MNNMYFDLIGREIVEVDSLMQSTAFNDDKKRRVGFNTVDGRDISTVFLGINHQYGNGAPLLFETIVFDNRGGENENSGDEYCERYSTYDEAESGHAKVVQWVKDGCPDIKSS